MAMQTVTDTNFKDVLAAPMAIVDFWSPDCPYCVKFKPIFEDVAAGPGAAFLMAEAQVDQNSKSIAPFNVNGLPAVLFLKNGKEVNRVEGSMEKADFLNEINKAFGAGSVPAEMIAAGSAPSTAINVGQVLFGGLVIAGIAGGIWWWVKQS